MGNDDEVNVLVHSTHTYWHKTKIITIWLTLSVKNNTPEVRVKRTHFFVVLVVVLGFTEAEKDFLCTHKDSSRAAASRTFYYFST